MKKITSTLVVIAITYLLSGCAQKIVAPGAELLTTETSALFKPDNKFSLFPTIITNIVAVYPTASETPIVKRTLFVEYDQIKIKPGAYIVLLQIKHGNSIAFPAASIDAKPGMTYLFTAKSVMDGAAVKATYKEIKSIENSKP